MIILKSKGLDYWKKKLIEVLNRAPMAKSLQEIFFGGTLLKSLPEESQEALIKARGYAVGTIREWKGKKYKKLSSGKWMRTYTGTGERGEQQAIRNVMKKIQNASSMSELSQIVSANMQRFKDENGKTLPIVKEFMEASRGTEAGKKVKEESVESLTKKFNNLKKLVSQLSESEKDPKEGTMSDKYYKTLREFQETRDKLNKLEEVERKKRLASPEYKKEQAEKQKILDRKEKVKQREREITSTTHENWERRQKKQIEGRMGNRGQGKVSDKPQKIVVKKDSSKNINLEDLKQKVKESKVKGKRWMLSTMRVLKELDDELKNKDLSKEKQDLYRKTIAREKSIVMDMLAGKTPKREQSPKRKELPTEQFVSKEKKRPKRDYSKMTASEKKDSLNETVESHPIIESATDKQREKILEMKEAKGAKIFDMVQVQGKSYPPKMQVSYYDGDSITNYHISSNGTVKEIK